MSTDLFIEQPTKFEFMTKLRMSQAFIPTSPQSLLPRADEVIQ